MNLKIRTIVGIRDAKRYHCPYNDSIKSKRYFYPYYPNYDLVPLINYEAAKI